MAKGIGPKVQKLEQAQIDLVEERVLAWLGPKLPEGFFVVDVGLEKEAGYWYLRLYIQRSTFDISLNDCEGISRKVDAELEVFVESLPDMAEFQYHLEVSSPGLFRQLKRDHEFGIYQGRPVKLTHSKSLAETDGVLKAYDPATQSITLEEGDISFARAEYHVTLNPTLKFGDGLESEPHGINL